MTDLERLAELARAHVNGTAVIRPYRWMDAATPQTILALCAKVEQTEDALWRARTQVDRLLVQRDEARAVVDAARAMRRVKDRSMRYETFGDPSDLTGVWLVQVPEDDFVALKRALDSAKEERCARCGSTAEDHIASTCALHPAKEDAR